MAIIREYLAAKGRRLSFEWAMIDGVNDRDSDARELAALCRRLQLPAHVNLIPLNPTPGYPTVGSSRQRVADFRDFVRGQQPHTINQGQVCHELDFRLKRGVGH